MVKGSEIQELTAQVQGQTTQIALLMQKVDSLALSVDRWGSDHEKRIRGLEEHKADIIIAIEGIRGRLVSFNLIQGALTAIASATAYWFAGRK